MKEEAKGLSIRTMLDFYILWFQNQKIGNSTNASSMSCQMLVNFYTQNT